MRIVFNLALALAVATATPSSADDTESGTVEIPLESIWALDMPDTRDIAGIDLPSMPQSTFFGWGFEEFKQYREQAVEKLRRALSAKPPSVDALAGFVVTDPRGMGLLALLNNQIVDAVASDNSPLRKNRIQSGHEAFLIFYSHPSSYHVRLKSVKRHGNKIDVAYAFEPHYTLESTVHFAMIPLGKLEAGEYQVHFTQQQMGQEYIDAGFIRVTEFQAKRFVSRPFSFTVQQSHPAVVPDTGDEISLAKIWALKMPGTRDVRELDPRVSADETLIGKIGRVLTIRTGERAKAGPCFLVRGEGKNALANAAKVLVDGESPLDATSIPADEDVSLVFYSYAAPGYVHLHSVRRSDKHVTVNYQVTVHQTSEMTVHFALIPLGKLAPGKFTVNAVEVDSGGPASDPAIKDRAICDSCAFVVREGGTQQ